jgi:hypothetical protein
MKRMIIMLTALLTMTASAYAIGYSQARDQALFLTDKMAYELNLTDDQYEAAYEINLDYLRSISNYDDVYNLSWRRRNLDLGYVLSDYQYRLFSSLNYFFRPLYYSSGWHFRIYSRYADRSFYYYNRPGIYVSYNGGHSWGCNRGRSWYRGRRFGHGGGMVVINRGGHRDRHYDGDRRHDYDRDSRHGRGGHDGYSRDYDDRGNGHSRSWRHDNDGYDNSRNYRNGDRTYNYDNGNGRQQMDNRGRGNDNRPSRGFRTESDNHNMNGNGHGNFNNNHGNGHGHFRVGH